MDDYGNDASTTALLDLSFADNFGTIDYAGDQDWLRLELAGGTSYEIHVHGQDLGFQLAQPRIRIFDSASHLIAEGDPLGRRRRPDLYGAFLRHPLSLHGLIRSSGYRHLQFPWV